MSAPTRRPADPLEVIGPLIILGAPLAGLTVLWLRSSDDPAAVANGNWSAAGALIALLLIAALRRGRTR